MSFGFSRTSDIYPTDIKMNGFCTSFNVIYKNKPLGNIELSIPGRHNVLNALAAVAVGLNAGLKFAKIADSIKDFTGVKRRFQLRADTDGVMLIDDYAHHPTEIKAVLDACANWKDKRIIAVFQPHRYTRTKFLAEEFGVCFKGADKVILTDIYAASEDPIEGISIDIIRDKIRAGSVEDVVVMEKCSIPDQIIKLKKPGDIILVLGAGDIKKTADELAKRLNAKDLLGKELVSGFRSRVKGNIRNDEPLARHTSFKIGAAAAIWAEPSDEKNLKIALNFVKNKKIPIFIIGNGTNLLAGDNGFGGIVIHLGSPRFKRIVIKGMTIRVGAGFSLPRLVSMCCSKGLGGLESLVGIPGTIGGAVYMNAGGWASPIYKNIGEMVESVKVMDHSGNIKRLRKKELCFGYRSSNLDKYVILEVVLKLDKVDKKTLVASLARFLKMKKEKQVLDMPSAGCVFKNPPDSQFTCGQMIDMLGLKGKRIGGAEVSVKHANFIINRKNATAKDVLTLAEFIRKKVRENYGIKLEFEVKVI